MIKADIIIPRSLLSGTSTTLWVYAHLLDQADDKGRVSIVPKWSKSIGLPTAQLHKALDVLEGAQLISVSASPRKTLITINQPSSGCCGK